MSQAAMNRHKPDPEQETFAARWRGRDHILIPKNGHHAIRDAMTWRGRGCARRIKVEEAKDPIVMWRHPADRLVSCWMHFKYTNTRYAQAYPGFPKEDAWRSFDAWVVAACGIPDDRANKHIRSQAALCHWNPKLNYTLVPWDFERYAQLLGVEKIEPSNQTKAARPFVSLVTLSQIQHRYAQDMEIWTSINS